MIIIVLLSVRILKLILTEFMQTKSSYHLFHIRAWIVEYNNITILSQLTGTHATFSLHINLLVLTFTLSFGGAVLYALLYCMAKHLDLFVLQGWHIPIKDLYSICMMSLSLSSIKSTGICMYTFETDTHKQLW